MATYTDHQQRQLDADFSVRVRVTYSSDAHKREAEVRKGPLLGRAQYEACLAILPNYDDGTVRPAWDDLPESYRKSWERP